MTLPITVCIPARNEELNLQGCLESLGSTFASVVVVDSASTDQTSYVAQAFGAICLDFKWDGHFPKKRNWFLRNHTITTPWVLFLDADERVTPEFAAELEKVLVSTSHVGFWLTYDNWFMGHQLRHGDTFRKLALFRVGSGEYERFPEDRWSHLDVEVHEHPQLEGTTGVIKSRLEHHDYRGLKHYIAKHNEYSSWEAHRFLWLRSADQHAWGRLNRRQRFKYCNLDRWWLAYFYFLMAYVARLGFLDGSAGWWFCVFKWRYFQDIRLKIIELQHG